MLKQMMQDSNKVDTVESVIRKIIAEKFGLEEFQVINEASFSDDLGVDSLDQVEMLMTLEKEFKLSIPEEESEKLRTVGSVIAYIKNKNH